VEGDHLVHLPELITDLAVILAAAAISTVLFSKLKQPIVLGYLIAGFAAGPHFPLWPTVVDTEGVKLWAEIGVIFLLFGLGLEFSFKKLAKVGKSAGISATFEIITMTALGYLFGRALGWTVMDSVYLGTILSVSSTTIIIRAYQEAGIKGRGFVNLVFGILIVEDLMSILLMVILSATSVPGAFSWSNLAFLAARLGFFVIIWYLVGIYAIPSVLSKIRRFLSREILLISAVSLCFLMVVLASKAGFSAALGAFIMGSLLAETEEGEKIEHLLLSVRDLFGAVFFVSVGMMIDPKVLINHSGIILLLTILTVVGKLLGSGFGAILSGQSLQNSVRAGMSLAQIGEFSFIIATLGRDLQATSDFLYPIVVAVSAVTTFTTPYMIRHSGSIYSWAEARLPKRFLDWLTKYERAMNQSGKKGAFSLLWKAYGLAVLLNSVVVIAIGLLVGQLALPRLIETFGDGRILRFLTCVATLIACSPFLLALELKAPKRVSDSNAPPFAMLRNLQPGILILRSVIGLGLIAFILGQFAMTLALPLLVLIATPILLLVFRKPVERLYLAVERRFMKNLTAKERAELESLGQIPELAPWNATLTRFIVSSNSKVIGKTLDESKFRTVTGATVVMIDRGRRRIFAPTRAERLLPNDQMFLIGTDEQLAAAQVLVEADSEQVPSPPDEAFNLESVTVASNSPYTGKSIREIAMPERLGSLVVGIERGSSRILNPESTTLLEPNDQVWVFGRRDKIQELKNAFSH
jgi:CPA2 family monovalent cation:H+ antiporter-2